MRILVVLTAFALNTSAQVPEPTDARGWLNHGVALFKEAKYQEAIAAFERVTMIEPRDANAHLYLGTTLMQIWIPGQQTPENAVNARRAEQEFKYTLEINPSDSTALASLTSLSYNEAKLLPYDERFRKLDESREWNRRLIAADPNNKDAHYWAGVLIWWQFYPALMTARVKAKMTPEDAGPLPPSNDKTELLNTYGLMVDDGISHLRRAIEIDSQYVDAMSYLNLLIRERADFRDTQEQYRRDVAEADIWTARALEAKKRQAQSLPVPRAIPATPPKDPATPQRIRVDGKVQEASLIRKVEPPVCPALAAQARISGVVRLSVTIDKAGTVQNIQVISGHPLLVPAALEAVKQWRYRPTLLNSEPVEVITQVDIEMHC